MGSIAPQIQCAVMSCRVSITCLISCGAIFPASVDGNFASTILFCSSGLSLQNSSVVHPIAVRGQIYCVSSSSSSDMFSSELSSVEVISEKLIHWGGVKGHSWFLCKKYV